MLQIRSRICQNAGLRGQNLTNPLHIWRKNTLSRKRLVTWL
jgi:hypothetical protein